MVSGLELPIFPPWHCGFLSCLFPAMVSILTGVISFVDVVETTKDINYGMLFVGAVG